MKQLKPLTGLRFIAALLVIVYHAGQFPATASRGLLRDLQRAGYNVASAGHIGVNLFFILSGFILAYNYIDNDGVMHATRREFWIARVARVYPMYLFGLAIALIPWLRWAPCNVAGPSCAWNGPAVTAVSTITLMQTWVPYEAIRWNPPGWSLSVEALFYLVFPFAAVQLVRLGRGRIIVTMVVLWCATLAWPLAYRAVMGASTQQELFNNFWFEFVSFNPLPRLPEFLLGVALSRLYLDWSQEAGRLAWISPGKLAFGALFALVAVLASGHGSYSMLNGGLVDPLLAALIFALAFSSGSLAWFLSLPFVVMLGEASYGMYILHIPLYHWLDHLVHKLKLRFLFVTTHHFTFFMCYLMLVIAASLVTLQFIEKPARHAIRNLASGGATRPAATLAGA